jgi:hypothetical protein
MLDIDQIFVITAFGIVTSYGLDGPGFEPQGGRDFPDSTSPAPRLYSGHQVSFMEVKWPERRDGNPPPSSYEVVSGIFVPLPPLHDYPVCYGIAYTRSDRTVDRDLPVDLGRFLVSIKIYLPTQYDQEVIV